MARSSEITVTRGNLGLLSSAIGFGGLIAGAVAFVWQGTFTIYVAVALIIGVIGMVLWSLITPTEFRAFLKGKSLRFGTITILATSLLVGIVMLVYLLLSSAALTWDLTTNYRFTLSNTTLDVLRRVTYRIQITGFYSPESLIVREIDDQFFRLYETATNGIITRRYYDPEEFPALAASYGVTQDAMVFISYVDTDGSVILESLARVPRGENQERDMTEAISRLLISGTLTVYFNTSLGERDPLDGTSEGISGINNGIRENGLITQPLDIRALAENNGDIPANASTVVLARPLYDLTEAEIAVIDRYLNNSGALFIASDVLFNERPFLQENGLFNQYLWENYGIRALDAAIVDPAMSGQTPLDIISAVTFGATDIGARLDPAETPTLFRLARAVDVNIDSAPQGIANGRVIMSSDQSYGERNYTELGQTNTYSFNPEEDIIGPLTTVVWAWDQNTNAKILLVGDGDFISNGQVLASLGNGVLFTDGMSWLTGLGERISFAPQAYSTGLPLMFMTNQAYQFIAFLVIILIPGVVLVTGLVIWRRRIRR